MNPLFKKMAAYNLRIRELITNTLTARWPAITANRLGFIIFPVGILILLVLLGLYFSSEPQRFDVQARITQELTDKNLQVVPGVATTQTLIDVTDTLLSKSGGFITNDIGLPGLFLDNMPSWEKGVLQQVRSLSQSLREEFARPNAQSLEDVDLLLADPRINAKANSWIFPASEAQYRDAIRYVNRYLGRLANPAGTEAYFAPRSAALNHWLGRVDRDITLLMAQLNASIGAPTKNLDMSLGKIEKTPWLKLDNVLYESRGTAWALIHFLEAIQLDFDEVLQMNEGSELVTEVIVELEKTQQSIISPFILNGSGFGLLPNHSLVMASYLKRAHDKLTELCDSLSY